MGRCAFCKQKAGLLTFACKYCESSFCTQHRLPEEHACSHISEMKAKCKLDNTSNIRNNVCVSKKIESI